MFSVAATARWCGCAVYFTSTVKWLRVTFQKPSFSLCNREILRSSTAELWRRFHDIMHRNRPNTMPDIQQTEKAIQPLYLHDRPESQERRSLLTFSDSSCLIFWTNLPPRGGHSLWGIHPSGGAHWARYAHSLARVLWLIRTKSK